MSQNVIMKSSQAINSACNNEKRGSYMIRILLADDEPIFLLKLDRLLQSYSADLKINVQIQKYTRDDMSSIVLSTFDIAFLDVDFGSECGSGIEIARRIRKCRDDTVIIFVTNFLEYAPEGYELKAFRYLLKSDIDTKLQPYYVDAVKHFVSKRETITIQNNGELTNILIDDILFLESDKHTIYIKMFTGKRKQYSCYSTLQSFTQKLEPLGFLRVHKSYLVNMKYISKLQCNEVFLVTGVSLNVSEKNYSETKKKYLLWKGAQTWNI